MASRYRSLNLTQLKIGRLSSHDCRLSAEMLARHSDPAVSLHQFFEGLPRTGAAKEMMRAADAIVQAALSKKDILWLIDGSLFEAGVSPILVQLVNRGLVQAIAMTGGAAVRDYEMGFFGRTCEDQRHGMGNGLLGLSRETGEGFNTIINEGVMRGFCIGECLSRGFSERRPKHFDSSVLGACASAGRQATATVHISAGAEGFQCYPGADGALLGKGSMKDLHSLAAAVEGLREGGVLVCATAQGSSLYDVFKTAFTLTRNVSAPVDSFTVVRFGETGRELDPVPGITQTMNIPGPLEIMLPLFSGALLSMIE